ncbi:MAG: DUF285 domain-containing protein [Pseudobdellovibrionaceae bacterium]|nr:DUF285 domain-containing protein [Bdellovibrionales bacterium]USN48334.1 MAG: DUF285 domain-containing protein [Pseudobdellovibrionaceae bacterium]
MRIRSSLVAKTLLLIFLTGMTNCQLADNSIKGSIQQTSHLPHVVNHAPVLDPIGDVLGQVVGTAIPVIDAASSGYDVDSDGDALTYSCFYDMVVDGVVSNTNSCSDIIGFSFDTATGVIDWVPGFSMVGDIELKIIASDGELDDSEVFKVEVANTVQAFTSTWQIATNGETLTIPLVDGFNYDFEIDWGDLSQDHITAWDDPAMSHVYATSGVYTVTIKGIVEAWRLLGAAHRTKLLTVPELGAVGWRNLSHAFADCTNLTSFNGGETSMVTSMSGMFFNSASVTPDTSTWDTSQVTDMSGMFEYATAANPDTSGWDTSQVTSMVTMFRFASNATPDTTNWDTSNVESMSYMFSYAFLSTPNTANWNTSKVTLMNYMFDNTTNANPVTTNWDTSQVTNMRGMFQYAASANPDTSSWNTSNVNDMSRMFYGATVAIPDTSQWDTSGVSNMDSMFYFASAANPDTSNWNTANVTTMFRMFRLSPNVDPIFTSWDFTKVVDYTQFLNATTISTTNYSNLLIRIEATSPYNSIILDGGGAKYNTSAATARANLIGRGWTITDGGAE